MSCTCPQCGAALPGHAAAWLCPQCLLSLAATPPVQEGAAPVPLITSEDTVILHHFGDYELLHEIARGGMGVVYKARQLSLNRIVAVKLLLFGKLAGGEFVQRFRAEAEAAASLRHPNIVAIHEIGEHDGQQYFSMDYVQGRDLSELVREGPLPAKRAAGYLKTIATAIQYAHECGVLHRDLKPSNILIGYDDEPHITDFGLAKRLSPSSLPGTPISDLTVTGQILGTPHYIPPEQAAGKRGGITHASDIYSLGAILYHLVTGRPPFTGETLEATLTQLLQNEPISPRLLDASIPRDLETICLKCLEKDAQKRYASAQELSNDLGRFLANQPILARPAGPLERGWRWSRRNPMLATSVGTSALLLIIIAIGSTLAAWRIQHSRATLAENLYGADIKLVEGAIARGELGYARELMSAHDKPETERLRGFEWGFFQRLTKGGQTATKLAHSNIVTATAFASRGELLTSASTDGRVRFWEFPSMRLRTELLVPEKEIMSLSYSHDGKYLAGTAAGEQGVFVWETASGQLAQHLPGKWARALFSPSDYTLIASEGYSVYGGSPGRVAILQLSSTNVIDLPLVADRAVWSADGKFVFASATTGLAQMFDLAARQVVRTFPNRGYRVSLACSPDGKYLATFTSGGDVHLWDVSTGMLRHELRGHTALVWQVAFSPDHHRLATVSSDLTVRLWEIESGRCLRTYQGHGNEVWTVGFSPDGSKLVTGDKDGYIFQWDLPKLTGERDVPEFDVLHGLPVFSPDGKMSAMALGGSRIAVVDLPAEQIRLVVPNADYPLWFSSDSQSLTMLSGNKITRLGLPQLNALETRLLSTIPVAPTMPKSSGWRVLAVSPDQRFLAVAEERDRVRLWDLSSGAEMEPIMLQQSFLIIGVRFAPDSQSLVVLGLNFNSVVIVSDGWKKQSLLDGHKVHVWDVAFSKDGRFMVSGSMDGTAKLWDYRAGKLIRTFSGNREGVSSVTISPDGKVLAVLSGVEKKRIKLWSLSSFRDLAELPIRGIPEFVEFSPDGQTLFGWRSHSPGAHFEFWQARPP